MKILDWQIALGRTASALKIQELGLLAVEEVLDPGDVDIVVLTHLDADPDNLLDPQLCQRLLIERPGCEFLPQSIRIAFLAEPEDLFELPRGEINVSIRKVINVTVDPPTSADDCCRHFGLARHFRNLSIRKAPVRL